MTVKTCFFIGHRDAPEELRPLLAEAIERHITEFDVTEFVVGHYGRFDAMAAGAVRKAKERHPELKLTLLLPYYPPSFDTSGYDRTYFPAGLEHVPKPFAIVREAGRKGSASFHGIVSAFAAADVDFGEQMIHNDIQQGGGSDIHPAWRHERDGELCEAEMRGGAA